jgi:pilus assembly protein Flp/PilA
MRSCGAIARVSTSCRHWHGKCDEIWPTSWVGQLNENQEVAVREFLLRLTREDEGQDLIEYALLAGFISLVAVVAITNVGTGVNSVYGNINTQVGQIPGVGS